MSEASAVITGIGLAAPNGLGVEAYWQAVLEGRSGIGRLTRFDPSGYPATLAGEILDFEAREHLPSRLLPQTDTSTRLALATADWALADAGLVPGSLADYAMGVITSNALGGFEFTHREFNKLWSKGPQFVSVYESFAWFYAVNTGQVSIRNGMRGPGTAFVGEQAGGLDAIGHARRVLRQGTSLIVGGGVDSALDPWGWASQCAGGRVTRAVDPRRGYLPFDVSAAGYVPGEGGALLVMESGASAAERGAPRVYGKISGYAATFDPRPGSGRPPGLLRAVELAIADAAIEPSGIDVVFADAAGIPELDRAEADALAAVFGPYGVPVTAPKALTGRLYSGAGPVDVATALVSMRDGVIPPTAHTANVPSEYRIDVVRGEPRFQPLRTALVLARGHQGFNSAVVVSSAN